MDQTAGTLGRLDEEISWYSSRSRYCQRMFKGLKLVTIGSAALIPLLAMGDAPPMVTAVLGAMIAIIEGVQQLNQYHSNWIAYRSTAEALKHEKYLHLAKAGPYQDAEHPDALLAERVEGLVSEEHAKWVPVQQNAAAKTKAAD